MSDQPHWLARTIEVYSVEDGTLVDEHVLPPVELALLQQSWQRPADDPMLDLFEVTEDQRAIVESLAGLKLHFGHHSYFLAAHTTDARAMREEGGFMGAFAAPRELAAFPDARRVRPKTSVR